VSPMSDKAGNEPLKFNGIDREKIEKAIQGFSSGCVKGRKHENGRKVSCQLGKRKCIGIFWLCEGECPSDRIENWGIMGASGARDYSQTHRNTSEISNCRGGNRGLERTGIEERGILIFSRQVHLQSVQKTGRNLGEALGARDQGRAHDVRKGFNGTGGVEKI